MTRCCIPPKEVLPARVNQHVCIIRPNPNQLDPRFLKYFLLTPAMQQYMLSLAGSGGTRNALTKEMIENFEIPDLVLEEQKTIADILEVLDKKTELNFKMNYILEQIVKTIFRSWFIDFEFPNEEGKPYKSSGGQMIDSELGMIPTGWRVSELGNVIELAYGKALREDVRRSGSVPVYGSNGCIGWHDKALVNAPGIIIGRKGNPGTVMLSMRDFFPIDTTFYVVPKGVSPACIIYFTS